MNQIYFATSISTFARCHYIGQHSNIDLSVSVILTRLVFSQHNCHLTSHTPARVHTHTHTHTHRGKITHGKMFMHSNIHTKAYIHVKKHWRAHAHTHTHTHTHAFDMPSK